jgi:hypothetical protein
MDNTARGYPAIIPPEVRYVKDLAPNAKLLYGELTVLCRKEGYCWASNTYFAELYGVSKFTISRWVSSLVDKGYIRIEMAPRDSTTKEVFRKVYLAPHLLTKSAIGIDENSNTPPQNQQGVLTETAGGDCQNQQGGIDENRKENKERLTSKDEQESLSKDSNDIEIHRPPEREAPPLPDYVWEKYLTYREPKDRDGEREQLAIWSEEKGTKAVIEAIEQGIQSGGKSLNYIGAILRNGGTANGKPGRQRQAQRRFRQPTEEERRAKWDEEARKYGAGSYAHRGAAGVCGNQETVSEGDIPGY